MDIQTQIEKAVTNGRGYNRAGFETKADFGFGKSETDSDAALQARLTPMGENRSYPGFYTYRMGNALDYFPSDELTQLDKDLKNLGLKDAVTTPEQVEQALKIKRYLTDLVQTQIKQAYPREQNLINFIKKKPSTDKLFIDYIQNLYKPLDPYPRHWKTLESLPEEHKIFNPVKEIFYSWDKPKPLKKTKEIFLKNEKNKL